MSRFICDCWELRDVTYCDICKMSTSDIYPRVQLAIEQRRTQPKQTRAEILKYHKEYNKKRPVRVYKVPSYYKNEKNKHQTYAERLNDYMSSL